MNKVHILGIGLNNLNKNELAKSLKELLQSRKKYIVTPNPEFLLAAQKDQEFFKILEQADLALPDGIGLKFASWVKGYNLKRYTGSNLVKGLLALANKLHLRVAVINWKGGLSNDEEIFKKVKNDFPRLGFFVLSIDRDFKSYNPQILRTFRPDIVFVGLGAPYQEKLIKKRLLKDLPSLRFAIGVGGSFDFITGKIKRAPKFFQVIGFEWLWRLIVQPFGMKLMRLKRIYNAVIVFPLAFIAWQFRRFFYRKNVVALIINKNNEVLILNSAGKNNYWGLPQGGVDRNEKLEEAVRREVFEETSLSDLEILASFKNIYQYDWPKHYTHSGYKGQRQSLFVMRYYGANNAVKTNSFEHKAYRWVKIDNLLNAASQVHRKQYELFLRKYYESKRTH